MECKKCQEMISLYVDDALTSEEKKEFDAHIAECSVCQEELEFMQKLLMHVHDLDDEKELPSDFHGNLMDKIDRIQKTNKVTPMKKLNNIRRYYSALAAVFVAVLIFGIIGIANLDKFGNFSMKSEDSVEYSGAPETQSENDSVQKDTAQYESGTKFSAKPSKNEARDKEADKDDGKSIQQFSADEPRSATGDGMNESPSNEGTIISDDVVGTNDVYDSKDNKKTSETSEMDSVESNPTDENRSEEVEVLESETIPSEKNDAKSKSDKPIIKPIVENKDSLSVQFNDDVNKEEDRGTNYTLTEGGSNANKLTTTQEDQPEEKQNNNQTYFVIVIMGLIILGIGFLAIKRRKRK